MTQALSRRQGGGRPLPDAVAEPMGRELGIDTSALRVHADPEAGSIARSVQADAFTYGNDIYFAPGSYQPSSGAGQRVLAHELSHVAAQRSGADRGTAGPLSIGRLDDPAEAAADRSAERVLGALRRSAVRQVPAPAPYSPIDRSVIDRLRHSDRGDDAAAGPGRHSLDLLPHRSAGVDPGAATSSAISTQNRAESQSTATDTAAPGTISIRRHLTSVPKPDSRIKVFFNEEVLQVIFVRQTETHVVFTKIVPPSTKGTSAQKKSAPVKKAEELRVVNALAFDLTMSDARVAVNAVASRDAMQKIKSSKVKIEPELLELVRGRLSEQDDLSDEILSAALVSLALDDMTVEQLEPDLDGWMDSIEQALSENGPELTNKQQVEGRAQGGGKPDWKTERTFKDQQKIRGELPVDFPGWALISEQSELDHKISRASLKHMMNELKSAPRDGAGVQQMHGFIRTVQGITNATTDEQKAIENWPANIELGFYSTEREGNPGSKFDGAYTKSGTATPRTQHLERADEIIHSDPINWAELVAKLELAQKEQERLEQDAKGIGRGPGKLTMPRKEIWEPGSEGKHRRRAKVPK